jgi:hypothetical protein
MVRLANKKTLLSAAALWGLALTGCGAELPADFKELPLDRQISVYGKYLNHHITSLEPAHDGIASHGGPAADRMSEYVGGKRSGFPVLEALEVIEAVQEQVCSLQGSSAQQALRDFTERDHGSQAEYTSAKVILQEIDTESDRPLCRNEAAPAWPANPAPHNLR